MSYFWGPTVRHGHGPTLVLGRRVGRCPSWLFLVEVDKFVNRLVNRLVDRLVVCFLFHDPDVIDVYRSRRAFCLIFVTILLFTLSYLILVSFSHSLEFVPGRGMPFLPAVATMDATPFLFASHAVPATVYVLFTDVHY